MLRLLLLLLLDVSVSRVSITRRMRNQLRRFDFHFVLLRFIKSIFYLFSFFFCIFFRWTTRLKRGGERERDTHAVSVGGRNRLSPGISPSASSSDNDDSHGNRDDDDANDMDHRDRDRP